MYVGAITLIKFYNKMNILILDDDGYRHEVFRDLYKNHNISHAYHYSQFLDYLVSDSPWDLIHLDHDLGIEREGDTYVDGWGTTREYNGQHAVQEICALNEELLPRKIIIQSINPVGGKLMLDILKRRGLNVSWEPFSA